MDFGGVVSSGALPISCSPQRLFGESWLGRRSERDPSYFWGLFWSCWPPRLRAGPPRLLQLLESSSLRVQTWNLIWADDCTVRSGGSQQLGGGTLWEQHFKPGADWGHVAFPRLSLRSVLHFIPRAAGEPVTLSVCTTSSTHFNRSYRKWRSWLTLCSSVRGADRVFDEKCLGLQVELEGSDSTRPPASSRLCGFESRWRWLNN